MRPFFVLISISGLSFLSFTDHTFSANGQHLHVKTAGRDEAPVLLMLHGFPEYWKAWASVGEHLQDRFRVVLPDQRGFNLSSKPIESEAYATKHLVADMAALMEQISPNRPFILCGHDWGASVAYAMAMRHADRVSHLIIANGVHPICFQKALFAGGAQTDASQYMNVLRAEGSEERLSANDFEKLLGMFVKFSAAPWLGEHERQNYIETWSQPGALSAMLNWYRGSPMQVPKSGTPKHDFPITEDMKVKYRIPMPHLLLWGLQDTALLPEARVDLAEFCDELTVIEHDHASHWILHEQPQWVADQIRNFLIKKA